MLSQAHAIRTAAEARAVAANISCKEQAFWPAETSQLSGGPFVDDVRFAKLLSPVLLLY